MTKETFPKAPERRENLTEAEEKAFLLLEEQRNKAAIKMEDFAKVAGYGPERVKADKERVARKRERIIQEGGEASKRAQILEFVLQDQIELSNWFGESTYTIVPSIYDDYFHGVDLALEIEDEEKKVQHLALGVDVTSSAMAIRKKMEIIKEHIKDGSLTQMEYFHSENHNPDFYGTMSNIPSVVIGSDSKTIAELSELWMDGYGLAKLRAKNNIQLSEEAMQGQREKMKKAKERLAHHRVQLLLLEEIKMQLVAFGDYAEKIGQTKVAEKMRSSLEIINMILAEKEAPSSEDTFKNLEDSVFNALNEAVADFENI